MTRYLITILTVFLISACSANREPVPPQIVPIHVVKTDGEYSNYSKITKLVCNESSEEALKTKEGKK